MASNRVQRTIESLLDEAEQAVGRSDWDSVKDRAQNVLALDPGGRFGRACSCTKMTPCCFPDSILDLGFEQSALIDRHHVHVELVLHT